MFLALLSGGCNNPSYLSENRPLETRMGTVMGQTGYQADSDLYILPVRQPTDVEQQALQDDQNARMLMLPEPWAQRVDFDIEIEYTLKNLDPMMNQAFVTLTGGNEFGDYNPMLYINPLANQEMQTPPPPLSGGTPINLDANQIINGVFREDQIGEASIDLEAITRYPSMDGVRQTPFEVVEHLSTVSQIGLDGVPPNDVTPMMVRFLLTLSSSGHVALDYVVRVRDHNAKLGAPGAMLSDLWVPTDAFLTPPAGTGM
jgi:hypothetical protein